MAVKHDIFQREAVYLGVAGYGTEAARDRDMLRSRFFEGHQEKRYSEKNPDEEVPFPLGAKALLCAAGLKDELLMDAKNGRTRKDCKTCGTIPAA